MRRRAERVRAAALLASAPQPARAAPATPRRTQPRAPARDGLSTRAVAACNSATRLLAQLQQVREAVTSCSVVGAASPQRLRRRPSRSGGSACIASAQHCVAVGRRHTPEVGRDAQRSAAHKRLRHLQARAPEHAQAASCGAGVTHLRARLVTRGVKPRGGALGVGAGGARGIKPPACVLQRRFFAARRCDHACVALNALNTPSGRGRARFGPKSFLGGQNASPSRNHGGFGRALQHGGERRRCARC